LRHFGQADVEWISDMTDHGYWAGSAAGSQSPMDATDWGGDDVKIIHIAQGGDINRIPALRNFVLPR
jgi:hypothetical protein